MPGAGAPAAGGTDTEDCICGLEEHTHDETCYDEAGELICGLEEHIHDENPDLITTCPYHTVERLILCRGAVYVFFSAMQAFILPESAFSGDEERQALLNFLKEKTQKAVEVWE